MTDLLDEHETDILDDIENLRREMYAAGFRPIAVYSHNAQVPSAGKRPVGKGWQEGAKEVPPRCLTEPVTHDALNTGILCNGLRPIDIDIDDPMLAATVQRRAEERFGPAPLKYRGNSAKRTLLYRAAEGEPPKKSRTGAVHDSANSVKVEVLGADNQMVAYGIHPSGVPIDWRDDRVPGMGVLLTDLVAISEDEVDAFLGEIEELIGARQVVKSAAATPHTKALLHPQNDHQDRTADLEDVIAALAAIPNDAAPDWDFWKRIAMATWAATGGSQEGYDAFATWSRLSPAHDENAARRCWNEVTASPPDRIGAGTLFHLASEAAPGWRKSSSGRFPIASSLPTQTGGTGRANWRDELPRGFRMSGEGLFYADVEEEGDQGKTKWVSAPFEVLGQCCDSSSNEWGTVIRFRDPRMVEHQKIIQHSTFASREGGSAIASMLEREGLSCSANPGLLRTFFDRYRPSQVLTIASSTGWHHAAADKWVYLLPNGVVIGDGKEDVVLAPEAARSGDGTKEAGDLAAWQQAVAQYAIGNSRHAFFMSAAFAGAMLAVNSEPSGGFHLVGKSRSGKSTAQFMAASVWGQAKARVAQWRATANGLEGMARAASDGPLFLDEIGQADAKQAGDAIYMLANEAGKQRARVDGSARERASWRTLFLSTGEIGLATKMGEANRAAATGLEVRLVNIEADAGAGLGAFETAHEFTSAADLADHLRMAANTNYGVASRVFLENLTEMRTKHPDALSEYIGLVRQGFRSKYVGDGSVDGQVESVAGRFSLVAAAGELAIHFGVLNWPPEEATRAAGKCFLQWLSSRGHTGAGEDEAAINHIRRFIMAHGSSRFAPYEAPDEEVRDRVGWRRVDRVGADYLFQQDQWMQEVFKGTTINPKRAIEALNRSGYLKTMEGRDTAKATIGGRKMRVIWVLGTILSEDE